MESAQARGACLSLLPLSALECGQAEDPGRASKGGITSATTTQKQPEIMSKLTFTPGEWSVSPPSYNSPARIVGPPESDTGRPVICEVEMKRDEWEANALLLAASKGLFEALQEIAERGPVDGYNSANALRLRLVATQSIARAAIAKATGNQ